MSPQLAEAEESLGKLMAASTTADGDARDEGEPEWLTNAAADASAK